MSSRLPDHCDLRNRVNLPGSGAPVVGIARRDVLGFLGVTDVEI